MKHSSKGALLSGLIFPGLGQVILKHYKRGIALMLAVFVCLFLFIVKATQQAFIILEKIESQGGAIDMSAISRAATEATTTSDSLILNLLLILIISFWVIGIVDAYRIGKKKDLEGQSSRPV
jgi:hypothetical protein